MMIIEALKELRLIQKRLTVNRENITKYAGLLSNEKPLFESENIQRKELMSLIQSCEDLITRAQYLKECIEYTNLITEINVCGKTTTISKALNFKRVYGKEQENVYKSLTTSQICDRMNILNRNITTPEQRVSILPMYDEKFKTTKLEENMIYLNEVESVLEITNAVTELKSLTGETVK